MLGSFTLSYLRQEKLVERLHFTLSLCQECIKLVDQPFLPLVMSPVFEPQGPLRQRVLDADYQL